MITDVLGYTDAAFRHNRRFAEVGAAMRTAAETYVRDVHEGRFPAAENVFLMPKAERALIEG